MLPEKFKRASSNDNRPRILLALEGGGSWGAITRGVLEALEDESILPAPARSRKSASRPPTFAESVVGVSGTSAGATNAVAFIAGMEQKKRGGVKRVMKRTWDGIGVKGDLWKSTKNHYRSTENMKWPNLPNSFIRHLRTADRVRRSPLMGAFNFAVQMGPFADLVKSQSGHLRDHIDDVIRDWRPIRASKIRLNITATRLGRDAKSNAILVEERFDNASASANVVGASGCVFGTHYLDGAHYKDGALTKNPACDGVLSDDEYDMLLAVHLTPEPDHVEPRHEDTLVAEAEDGFLGHETYSHYAYERERGRNVQVIKADWELVKDLIRESGRTPPENIEETSKYNFDSEWIELLTQAGRIMGHRYAQEYRKDMGRSTQYTPNKKETSAPSPGLQDQPEVA